MIKIRLNIGLGGHPAGSIIDLKDDGHGTPLDMYWARRIEDAKIDNCVEVISIDQPAKPKGGK